MATSVTMVAWNGTDSGRDRVLATISLRVNGRSISTNLATSLLLSASSRETLINVLMLSRRDVIAVLPELGRARAPQLAAAMLSQLRRRKPASGRLPSSHAPE